MVFNHRRGGLYFVLPKGLDLESIKDNTNNELFSQFPNQVNSSNNGDGAPFRFFNREENSGSFNDQWGWSAGQANPNGMIKGWKEENRFSKIYFIDNITTTTQLTYTLTASVTEPTLKSFPFVAVMKSFGYTNSWRTEVTSLGAREITLEKEKPLPPKETPVPEAPLVPKEEPKKKRHKPHKRHRLLKKTTSTGRAKTRARSTTSARGATKRNSGGITNTRRNTTGRA